MYCPRCGKENTDNVEYCLFCGERLGRRNKKNGTDPIIYMAIITGILAVLFVIMLVFTFTNTRQKNRVSTAGTREAAQFIETTAALGEPAGQNSVSAQSDMPAAASETASQGPVKEVQNTDAVSEAFNTNELIKVSVLKNCTDDPKELGTILAERTGSTMVCTIGKKIVLYKPDKKEPQIVLPK